MVDCKIIRYTSYIEAMKIISFKINSSPDQIRTQNYFRTRTWISKIRIWRIWMNSIHGHTGSGIPVYQQLSIESTTYRWTLEAKDEVLVLYMQAGGKSYKLCTISTPTKTDKFICTVGTVCTQ
jgi:hypothetical protein